MALVSQNFYWLFALLLAATPAWAETDEPSLELLEFLAEWQDGEGDWVDPVEFSGYETDRIEDEQNEESSYE